MVKITKLPQELRHLVHDSVALLGEVIKEHHGRGLYRVIDGIRQQMVDYRVASSQARQHMLNLLLQKLTKKTREQRAIIAHSFTIMLELINACENAYRTYRLQQQNTQLQQCQEKNLIVFVLTAHPTESRTAKNISLFHQIQNCCVEWLTQSNQQIKKELKHLLAMALLIPVSKHRKPNIQDEAEHIFSIVFRSDIFDALLTTQKFNTEIRIRTWVGGDKDGHPGVDEHVMLQVMNLSRRYFYAVFDKRLKTIREDISLLNLQEKQIERQLQICYSLLHSIKNIADGDGARISKLEVACQILSVQYQQLSSQEHPAIVGMMTIFRIFPGLIIPLELREEASEIHSAVKNKKLAIAKMVQTIAKLSKKTDPNIYSKGLIISMTKSVEDIEAGVSLIKQYFSDSLIRVVPLFETAEALNKAPEIIEKLLSAKSFRSFITKKWQNKFEIMLGYSDSAKMMGMLSSRLAIANCINAIDEICRRHSITPIYFHGSGGSVDRGGGSIEEQTAWWPASSFAIYKATIQGEMVERFFSSKEILLSAINKLEKCYESRVVDRLLVNSQHLSSDPSSKLIEDFASQVTQSYQQMLNDPLFIEGINKATLYPYLSKLKFGSRPSKRAQAVSLETIRAIPWVLCWVQTRTLFPSWWGVGEAWKIMQKNRKALPQFRHAFQDNAFFRSFVKLLGFTLSKVDLNIWYLYLEKSSMPPEKIKELKKCFSTEYKNACQFVRTVTGEKKLLWFRPWLSESIRYRSSMIHVLNIIQIIALSDKDFYMVRETTSGIASGMLTTG